MFRDYFNKHKGETAWVVGKGPALDTYDFSQAGPLRACINESVLHVPNPTYFFSADEGPIRAVAGKIDRSVTCVLNSCRRDVAKEVRLPNVVYHDGYLSGSEIQYATDMMWVRKHARLYDAEGTICPLLHFLRMTGVRDVVLVGCNGKGTYAECVGEQRIYQNKGEIARAAIDIMRTLKMSYRFVEDDPTPPARRT